MNKQSHEKLVLRHYTLTGKFLLFDKYANQSESSCREEVKTCFHSWNIQYRGENLNLGVESSHSLKQHTHCGRILHQFAFSL